MTVPFVSGSFLYGGSAAQPLDQVLREHFTGASWGGVRKLISTGKVRLDGETVSDSRRLVEPGSQLTVQMTAPKRQKGVLESDEQVLYCDPHLLVVDKQVGISSVDHERESTSLQSQLREWLSNKERRQVPPLRVVHRLDKVTSGVMLFARTKATQLALKEQFRAHTTGRYYIAVAHGAVHDATLSFRLIRDRGDGIRGVTFEPNRGNHSVTHITRKEQLSRCCVLQCRLETGRTHQIRIHLEQIGHPLVGDPLYTRYDGPLLQCSRALLHAAFLSFNHPAFRKPMRFERPLPAEFEVFLAQERKRAHLG